MVPDSASSHEKCSYSLFILLKANKLLWVLTQMFYLSAILFQGGDRYHYDKTDYVHGEQAKSIQGIKKSINITSLA